MLPKLGRAGASFCERVHKPIPFAQIRAAAWLRLGGAEIMK